MCEDTNMNASNPQAEPIGEPPVSETFPEPWAWALDWDLSAYRVFNSDLYTQWTDWPDESEVHG